MQAAFSISNKKKIVSIVSIVFKNNASEKLKKYCL